MTALAGGLLLWSRARGTGYETDLMALLPTDSRRPLVSQAVGRMAEAGSRRVVVLLRHRDIEAAGRAADACSDALKGRAGIAHVMSRLEADVFGAARDFYLPWRYRLLTPAQRERLRQEPDSALLSRATQSLYSPIGPPRLAPLESDPFGLFTENLLEAASRSSLSATGDRLTIPEGGGAWVVVFVELSGHPASIAEQQALSNALDAAVRAAKQAGAEDVLRAGFVLHSARASRQAQREMSTIAVGSLLGIVLLMLLTFGSFKPLALVMLPIGVGCLLAMGLSRMFFERLHLLTFVFGTSVIGVAVDYGILYVSGCADPTRVWDAGARIKGILPTLGMALTTSLVGYAVLAALPFPILREMAVFSILGLGGAWLSVAAWLPGLSRRMPDVHLGPLPGFLERAHARWPSLDRGWGMMAAIAGLLGLSFWGMTRLRPDDDVRRLFIPSSELMREQERVERLMRLPGAGQFFLLSAPDEQTLLERSETLAEGLEAARRQGHIADFQSVSQFVPSLRRQEADRALMWRRIYRDGALASKLFGGLGSPEAALLARRQAEVPPPAPLTPRTWLDSPLSEPFRSLWMGRTAEGWSAAVTLSGVGGPRSVEALKELAGRQPGTVFVDHLFDLSKMMRGLRVGIGRLLVLGHLLVAACLFATYRRRTWRVVAPTMLASLYTLGIFGLTGQNSNLFCILGLALVLSTGIDYGIFLQDRRAGDHRVALLSSSLAAMTTLLSFGLLALSRTPALHTFGLSMLLGIGLSWLLGPCFRGNETS